MYERVYNCTQSVQPAKDEHNIQDNLGELFSSLNPMFIHVRIIIFIYVVSTKIHKNIAISNTCSHIYKHIQCSVEQHIVHISPERGG